MLCVEARTFPWLRSTQTHVEIFCVAAGASCTGDAFPRHHLRESEWDRAPGVSSPAPSSSDALVISSPRFPCC